MTRPTLDPRHHDAQSPGNLGNEGRPSPSHPTRAGETGSTIRRSQSAHAANARAKTGCHNGSRTRRRSLQQSAPNRRWRHFSGGCRDGAATGAVASIRFPVSAGAPVPRQGAGFGGQWGASACRPRRAPRGRWSRRSHPGESPTRSSGREDCVARPPDSCEQALVRSARGCRVGSDLVGSRGGRVVRSRGAARATSAARWCRFRRGGPSVALELGRAFQRPGTRLRAPDRQLFESHR